EDVGVGVGERALAGALDDLRHVEDRRLRSVGCDLEGRTRELHGRTPILDQLLAVEPDVVRDAEPVLHPVVDAEAAGGGPAGGGGGGGGGVLAGGGQGARRGGRRRCRRRGARGGRGGDGGRGRCRAAGGRRRSGGRGRRRHDGTETAVLRVDDDERNRRAVDA